MRLVWVAPFFLSRRIALSRHTLCPLFRLQARTSRWNWLASGQAKHRRFSSRTHCRCLPLRSAFRLLGRSLTYWEVVDVAFNSEPGRIDFHLAFASGTRFACPHCGAEYQPVHDTLERDWRHLNFSQLQAYIHAKVPRVRCNSCAKTTPRSGCPGRAPTAVLPDGWRPCWSPYARRWQSLRSLNCLASTADASGVPLDHFVDQAHAQEDFSTVTSVGLDETASRRGHNHISLFHRPPACALRLRRAKSPGRSPVCRCARGSWRLCREHPRTSVWSVWICRRTTRLACVSICPGPHTFDEFHIIQLVNKVVDEVRRQEVKRAPERRCPRYIWIKDKPTWSNRQIAQFADLKSRNLKTHHAFRIQETLRKIFHSTQSTVPAEPLLDKWYSWAQCVRF